MQNDRINLQYKKNFITDILFRIDFSPILIINDEVPTNLQNKIRDFLPEFNENKVISIKATITGNQVINEPEKRPEWQFFNKEKTIFANLSFDNFNIVVKDYRNFEEYKKYLLKILNPFYEYYKPVEIKRIGLRYINKIILKEGDPLDWGGYINDKLVSQLKLFMEPDNYISRSMGQIILNKEDYNLIFNYGIYNSEFPARVARKEFILDYDCNTNVCNFEEVEAKVIKFNFEIKKLFENSIGDKLRLEMEIEK